MEEPKFDKIYKVAMNMADTLLTENPIVYRFEKLDEEYKELVIEAQIYLKAKAADKPECLKPLKDELSDVLFVLLHTAHKLNITPFELLHHASSKMLNRFNDPNYKRTW